MDASIRGLAIPYLLRGLSRRDWARFCEKHGLPITGAIVPEEADTDDKDNFFDDLRQLAGEGIVMLPRDRDGKGFGLEMIEPKNVQAWQGFEHVLLHCDVSIAVELLGQASNAQEGGSYAKAVALGTIRQDLLEADASSIAETIRADQPARFSVAMVAPAAAHVSGQIFGASGENIILYSQPRPVETVTKEEGWTVQSILDEAVPKMAPKFFDLNRGPMPGSNNAQQPAAAKPAS
jgi:hypothetical protein